MKNTIKHIHYILVLCILAIGFSKSHAQNNVLPYDWTLGSGSTPFYNQNGATSENERLMGEDPFGNTSLLWRCGNEPDNNGDGGWNTDYFTVDTNSTYRYAVWVKRTGSQNGGTYHGTQNVNTLSGTQHGNPYFWAGNLPTLNEWYLLVGIVHPKNYTGSDSGISGVYDQQGLKVLGGTDFKWRTTTSSTRVRSYLFYATDISVRQYFYGAKFQKIDDVNAGISDLISGEAPAPNNDDFNWTSTSSYDFSGKTIAKSVGYFDAVGNVRQNQSWDVLTDKIWNSEIRYDKHGRPALQTLSAPVSNNTFSFEQDFIRQTNGSSYISSNFESNPENPAPVGAQTNTLGWYYSNSNTTEPYQDITPYPFSRTVHSKLNPGKVKAIVGGNKINGQWLQSYSFTMPAPGQGLGYSKTVSRNVHGVDVVVFTDAEGNTVKAARSGNEEGTKPIHTVNSLIKEQGYVDIHISKGCSGITITNPTSNGIKVYNLITENQVSSSQFSGLSHGFYRVSVSNSDTYVYNPSQQIRVAHENNYYDFSTNTFDKAGRLLQSTQPNGTALKSTFAYNSLGQLQNTSSTDEGTASFKYRKDGQIRFSQNTEQVKAGEFSYTNYDNYGRPIESGVLVSNAFTTANPDNSTLPSGTKKEQTFTFYDTPHDGLGQVFINSNGNNIPAVEYTQSFLAGNVSATYNLNPYTNTTWYSYDAYGRVIWMVQYVDGLGIKTIDYEYDFGTGQVTKVLYQKHVPSELFVHRYTYNDAGQLTKVETSTNSHSFETQADYTYYESSALKRTELANGIQGIDYIYNLNGQLKSINHPDLTASKDPGGDSNDLFGMQLDYYNTDYARSQRSNISTSTVGTNQYNGNIKGMRWNTNGTLPQSQQSMYNYSYNKNNWLSGAEYGVYVSGSTASNGSYNRNGSRDYEVSNLTYDANGNIQSLKRNGYTGGGTNPMDNLSYNYKPNTNQLNSITDTGDNTNASRYDDIKNQLSSSDVNNGLVNYIYNNIGQLKVNLQDKLSYAYNASGLTTKISAFTDDHTNEWGTLLFEDYDNTGLGAAQQWIVGGKGSGASIFSGYAVANDLNYICTYLNQNYGSSLNLNINKKNTSSATRIIQTVPDANHRLQLDVIALQSTNFILPPPFGSGQPEPMGVGYMIRIISKSGVELASQTINPSLRYVDDPDFGNQGGCGYYYDDFLTFNFSTTSNDDTVTLEITPYTSGNSSINLYLDNLSLEANTETKVAFFYDDKGKRIRKETYTMVGNRLDRNITYYVRDVAGSPMAIYNEIQGVTQLQLKEQPIYGASRLGIHYRQTNSDAYQLTDHLGNVRAVIIKQGANAAAITAKTDYYPGGMPMPNRNIQGGYRYGYQGEFAETDPETKKSTFELRLYDPRINRWISPDPKRQYYSPYLGMGNNWVNGIDPDGGYVYFLTGLSPEIKQRLINVLKTQIGAETVEWFIKNPHNHIHIGYGPYHNTKGGGHYGVTIGASGIFSDSDLSLTENDIANIHGRQVASHYFPYLDGARKDKGRNWYILLRPFDDNPYGPDETLFHEIRAHVYNKLFFGTKGGDDDHYRFSGTKNGHYNPNAPRPTPNYEVNQYLQQQIKAQDFMTDLIMSFRYWFTKDNTGNEKVNCGCGVND